jgi:hypothetical protein
MSMTEQPNIVDQAYRDLAARQAEADAINRGNAPRAAGTFRSREEWQQEQPDPAREAGRVADAALAREATAPAVPTAGLAGRRFAAFFASDVKARKVEFEIGGNPAAVWVRKLNPDDYDTLLDHFMQINASQKTTGTPDLGLVRDMNRFLIPRAVTGAELWRRDGEEWAKVGLPEGREARIEFIEREFQCSPEVWQALVTECLQEQGLGGDQPGE